MDKKIKIPETRYAKYMTLLCRAVLIITFLYLMWSFDRVPAKIPTHYNGAGKADAWGSRWSLWFPYVVSILLYLGITFAEKYPEIWNTGVTITRNNRDSVYLLLKHMIVTLKMVVTVLFSYLSIQATTGKDLGGWFLPVTLFITFAPVAWYLVRIVRIPK